MANRLQIEKEIESKRQQIDNTLEELGSLIRQNVRKKAKTAQKTASAIFIATLLSAAAFGIKLWLLKKR